MKFSLVLALLTAFALTSCEIDQPPPVKKRPVAKYPTTQPSQYPPQPQPFPQDPSTTPPGPVTPAPEVAREPQTAPAPASAPQPAKGDFPYGVPVPGKAGFVRSPYSPDKMTDVRGYAPGTEVKDPYTGKTFLVP
ncbi:MAG: hypothetical protein ABI992_01395 [Chthoniobacterales bacterium]